MVNNGMHFNAKCSCKNCRLVISRTQQSEVESEDNTQKNNEKWRKDFIKYAAMPVNKNLLADYVEELVNSACKQTARKIVEMIERVRSDYPMAKTDEQHKYQMEAVKHAEETIKYILKDQIKKDYGIE